MDPKNLSASSAEEETANIQKAIEKIADHETEELTGISATSPAPTAAAHPDRDLTDEAASFSDEDLADEAASHSQEYRISETEVSEEVKPNESSQVHHWFFTFMCMNLPIIGWIYLLYLAFNKKYTDRRSFARAYLFYKLIFLIISILILGILVYIGLDLLDTLLAYMEML